MIANVDAMKRLLGSMVLLHALTVILATMWWVPPGKNPNVVICLLAVAPLIAVFVGFVALAPTVHIWLAVLMLGYFLAAFDSLVIHGSSVLAWTQLANSMMIEVLVLWMLWYKRKQRLANEHA